VDGEGEVATYEEAWYLAGAVVGLQALSTLCFNHNMYLAIHIGMKMKASTCSLIFRKVIRIISEYIFYFKTKKILNRL
jgi:hypothetical protein